MAGFMPDFTELLAKRKAEIDAQTAKNKAMFGDLQNAAGIVGWGGPTAIGAGLGALTAPKNKGLQSTLRGAGLGAALHAGTSLGLRAGNAMAGGNSPTGALVGAGVGGLGSTLAAQYLLPRVDDDETPNKKEKSAMSFYSFGAKIANYVDLHNAPEPAKKELPQHEVFNNALTRAEAAGEKPSPELFARIQKEHDDAQKTEKKSKITGMTFDPDNANVKKLKAQHPNNWRQVMAKSQGLSDSSMAKAIKKAQSACSPCAMPNSPTNKKPYTSASPAVTDASQKSVEIGKPPVTKTEHSEAKAKQPEEGAKSAYAFGRKVAAINGDEIAAKYDHPRAPVYGDPPPPAAPSAPDYLPQNPGDQLANKMQRWPHLADKFKADAVKADAAGKATRWPKRTWSDYVTSGEAANDYIAKPLAGARDTIASGIAYATVPSSKAKAVNTPEARAAIGGTQEARDAVNNTLGPLRPEPTATAGSGILDTLYNNRYPIAGGLGALGLGGLLYYLNSQPKKKKRDEEEEV
jgi:hypothetical protein